MLLELKPEVYYVVCDLQVTVGLDDVRLPRWEDSGTDAAPVDNKLDSLQTYPVVNTVIPKSPCPP